MLVLLYKFLLEESYDHIEDIKKKQAKGKYMSDYEEDILVNVHLIENYLDNIIEQRANFSKKLAMSLLDKEKFNKFTSKNH
jgi:predicted metal-binding protein